VLSVVPGGVEPHVKEYTRRIVRDCAEAGHPVTHVWGYSSAPGSDHRNRRCVDLMVANKADGDWILGYLRRWEQQLHLRYVIWRRRQWRDYFKPGVIWHRMRRYTGSNPHTDHLHVEFDAA
jgi:hypothetical protein